jgi:hypothetical protein
MPTTNKAELLVEEHDNGMVIVYALLSSGYKLALMSFYKLDSTVKYAGEQ